MNENALRRALAGLPVVGTVVIGQDILAIGFSGHIPSDQLEAVKNAVTAELPDLKLWLLDRVAGMAVIKQENVGTTR